jgi:hypothetical protein
MWYRLGVTVIPPPPAAAAASLTMASPSASSRVIVYARTAAIIAVGSHVGVTLASMAYSTGRFGGANAALMLRDDQKGPREEIVNSRHFVILTEFVTQLYGGKEKMTNHHEHVQLDPNITFEDPAAICVGQEEVYEAFRALYLTLHPESIRRPRCIDVKPKGASLWVTYGLYQRYSVFGGWWTITLPSLLVVQVQLKQRTDKPQSDFLVLSMKEEWNGVPLLTTFLNRLVRRGNGIASYHLTRWCLSSPKA